MADNAPAGELQVLTLNIARPSTDRAKALLGYLWGRPEPLLVLTEAGLGTGSALIAAAFRAAGNTVFTSVSNAGERGVLVVDRGCEFVLTQDPGPVTAGERILSGRVGALRVAGVYGQASDPVRYAGQRQRQRKREWLLAYAGWLAQWLDGPSLVIGDLNVVDPEFEAPLPYVLGEELAIYHWMMDDLRLTDAFRQHNPPQNSWFDHSGVGCRYDHALTNAAVQVVGSDLDDRPRQQGITDHAALQVEIRW